MKQVLEIYSTCLLASAAWSVWLLSVYTGLLHTVYVIVKPQLGLYLFHLSGFLGASERERERCWLTEAKEV